MTSTLNIPVIGSGSIGTRHHQNLLSLGVISELLSYRDGGVERVAARLQKGGVDGVVIATATAVRVELISLCATHDVPMYIEKPLAFTLGQVEAIYRLCSPVLAAKSMVGFMMRYHPLLQRVLAQNLNEIYRFDFVIGHDVTQWRQNWSFANSYASNAAGGGVLLDLCHELDMAKCLFPEASIESVTSVGHRDFPEVDFATNIALSTAQGALGTVSMDYLSPVSTRAFTLYGKDSVTRVDLNALEYNHRDGKAVFEDQISFDRNDMFIDAMKDFLALLCSQPVTAFCPRLDGVRAHCEIVANAWQQRRFIGQLSHQIT